MVQSSLLSDDTTEEDRVSYQTQFQSLSVSELESWYRRQPSPEVKARLKPVFDLRATDIAEALQPLRQLTLPAVHHAPNDEQLGDQLSALLSAELHWLARQALTQP